MSALGKISFPSMLEAVPEENVLTSNPVKKKKAANISKIQKGQTPSHTTIPILPDPTPLPGKHLLTRQQALNPMSCNSDVRRCYEFALKYPPLGKADLTAMSRKDLFPAPYFQPISPPQTEKLSQKEKLSNACWECLLTSGTQEIGRMDNVDMQPLREVRFRFAPDSPLLILTLGVCYGTCKIADDPSFCRYYSTEQIISILGEQFGINTLRPLHAAPAVEPFAALLAGNQCEIMQYGAVTESVFADTIWNNWKKFAPRACNEYVSRIYPPVLKVFKQIIPLDRFVNVVELCAGDGFFAALALSEFGQQISQYHLVDRNHISLEEAAKNLAHFPQATLHEQEITNLRNIAKPGTVYLAFGIGALTSPVVSIEDAFEAARQMCELLEPGGYAVLTGYGPSLLNSGHWKALGLSVINMWNPEEMNYLYVLRKNIRNPTEEKNEQ